MIASKIQVINCGTHHVTAAVFTRKKFGDLTLEHLISSRFNSDLSNEKKWLDALEKALKALLAGKPIRGPVSFILPGRLFLTKRITAPHVEGSSQTKVILYKAQQSIPCAPSEVVIDYHILSDDGVEVDVFIAAAKAKMIANFYTRMKRLGLDPRSIRAAPALDYNALQFIYPDSKNTLLVNLGTHSSNLLLSDQKGFHFRTIAFSDSSLKETFPKPLSVQTQTAKITFSEDKNAVGLDNTQDFKQQLSLQISRFITHYHHKKGGSPSRILLTGQGAYLPELNSFLKQEQNIEVDHFNPTRHIAIGKNVAKDHPAIDQLSEIIGEARASLNPRKVDINLLPKQTAIRAAFKRRKPFILAALLCLATSTLFPLHYFATILDRYQTQDQLLSERRLHLQSYRDQIVTASQTTNELHETIQHLTLLLNSRSNWVRFFADLQSRLHAVRDVWLDAFEAIPSETSAPQSTTGAPIPSPPLFKWRLSGQLLVRSFDLENPNILVSDVAIERIETLLESLKESPFIEDVEGLRFDTRNPRILKFKFHLIPNKERPL